MTGSTELILILNLIQKRHGMIKEQKKKNAKILRKVIFSDIAVLPTAFEVLKTRQIKVTKKAEIQTFLAMSF